MVSRFCFEMGNPVFGFDAQKAGQQSGVFGNIYSLVFVQVIYTNT